MTANGDAVLAAVATPELASILWRSDRAAYPSAWHGHVAFAHWIVEVARPRVICELGTQHGVSFAAFCHAVASMGMDTKCFAIDTWKGDAQTGDYGDEVYRDLQNFITEHYGNFASLIRRTFDEASSAFPDGSIDLLHIDGLHTYEAVQNDYETWRPKLSNRAIVLFHDVEIREEGFGVWRFWNELRYQYPSFTFTHAAGLGVLVFGANVDNSVKLLCAIKNTDQINNIRENFAKLSGVTQGQDIPRGSEAGPSTGVASPGSTHVERVAAANKSAITLSWAMEQIAPLLGRRWQAGEIAAELDRLNRFDPEFVIIRLYNNKAELIDKPMESRYERHDFIVERAGRFVRFLETLVIDTREPLLLGVFVGDGHIEDPKVPTFSFQKKSGNKSILLPDVDFFYYKFYDEYKSLDKKSFGEKRDEAIFVGATSGGGLITLDKLRRLDHPRIRSAVRFRGHDSVHFHLPRLVQYDSEHTLAAMRQMGFADGGERGWEEQLGYKFIISIDGNGATCSRVVISLLSNSVLLKYESDSILYYFSGMRPWVHYVPISADRDVEAALELLRARPEVFEAIAAESRHFAREFLSEGQVRAYATNVVRLYRDLCIGETRQELVATERSSIRILTHMRNVGDSSDDGRNWVMVPAADLWIEGFAILSEDYDLAQGLSYRAFDPKGQATAWVGCGEFCGTRGRSEPLSGFQLRLEGVAAAKFECRCYARFANGQEQEIPLGDGARVAGEPSPLLGMRIRIVPAFPR